MSPSDAKDKLSKSVAGASAYVAVHTSLRCTLPYRRAPATPDGGPPRRAGLGVSSCRFGRWSLVSASLDDTFPPNGHLSHLPLLASSSDSTRIIRTPFKRIDRGHSKPFCRDLFLHCTALRCATINTESFTPPESDRGQIHGSQRLESTHPSIHNMVRIPLHGSKPCCPTALVLFD